MRKKKKKEQLSEINCTANCSTCIQEEFEMFIILYKTKYKDVNICKSFVGYIPKLKQECTKQRTTTQSIVRRTRIDFFPLRIHTGP